MCQNFKKIRRVSLCLALLIISCNSLFATSAYPYPITFTQPNGDTLTITMKGDEFIRFAITEDGYTLLYDSLGYFRYAQLNAYGDMEPSEYIAKSINNRTPEEILFLQTIQPGLYYSQSQLSILSQIQTMRSNSSVNLQERAIPTTGNRKLLCVLIGFQDKAFGKTQAEFYNLFNQVNYNNTGSVRDYFMQASYNQLDLSVDVVGPYIANQNVVYYGANNIGGNDVRPGKLVQEAIDSAYWHGVNFSTYASSNIVEEIYVIYAGYGEEAGGGANCIWAHAQSGFNHNCGGFTFKKYACSSELRGNSGNNITNIGVICHEFGHSLGAPDYYDTRPGVSTQNQYIGTGSWDLMASGNWNNNGISPAHPNPRVKVDIYKWAVATELTSPQLVTIYPSINNRMAFYKISTKTPGEHFIIENRQQIGFDSHIPGNGLMIYRCRQGIANIENNNTVNRTHPQGFYPVCASSNLALPTGFGNYGNINSIGCPFPFASKDSLTDVSIPSMQSWAGVNTEKPITNISGNTGVITFNFMRGDSAVINAYASEGGTISPSGAISVNSGNNYTFTFTPDNGEVIEEVLVDSVNVPAAVTSGSYTFTNVTESHNIYVRFSNPACPPQPTPVTASFTNQTDCMLLNQCAENQSETNSPWTVWSVAVPPLTGSGIFAFYSRSYSTGSSAQLIMPKIITNNDDYTASFWMYRDNTGTYGGQNYQDKVNVYFSTTPSIIGLTPIYTVHRCRNLSPIENVDGWYYYSVSIPTIYTNSAYVIFEAVGEGGNNIYVDEFYIDETVPTLKVKPTILNFNAVTVNTTSIQKIVTVSGIMTDNFTYVKTGTNANDFTITETFWDTNRGGILSVTFTPSGVGTRTAEIIISSDGIDSQVVTLNGIGLDNSPFYCAGTGTAISPYQICSASQLAAFAAHVNAGNATSGRYYVLANDIDLSGYSTGLGWEPIGNINNDFQGNFNGNGKVIRNLSINRPTENFVGLFSFSNGATIQNLGIENANIKGKSYVGCLVGDMYAGSTINNCYAIGSVNGNEDYVGGLIGYNYNSSSITDCYASCNVSGNYFVGGLVGYNVTNSSITNCYATNEVSGNSCVGGLVGYNYSNSIIQNSIAANNSVIATSTVNRITGYNHNSICNNNYSINTMVVRDNNGNVSITDGLNTNVGLGKNLDTLQNLAFYTAANNWHNNTAWNINSPYSIWSICEDKWLPFLRWQGIDCDSIFNIIANANRGGTITPNGKTTIYFGENKTFTFVAHNLFEVDKLLIDSVNVTDSIAGGSYTFVNVTANHTIDVIFKLKPFDFCGGDGSIGTPYEICTAEQLKKLADYINLGYGDSTRSMHYILMNDINLNAYIFDTGWKPIGDYNSGDSTTCFQGNFQGNNKVIQNLTINRQWEDYIGLFGRIYNATIENLGVNNCNIVGGSEVGGLVGLNYNSIISNCYVTGNVSGSWYDVGGLAGANYGSISNCYATGTVNGFGQLGGLVGANWNSISNCYTTNSVSGTNQYIGGIAGVGGTIRNCVAANDIVTTTSNTNNINRITGNNWGVNNNYALNTMIIKNSGGSIPITGGLHTAEGMSKDMDTLQSFAFYATAGNWYQSTAWNINPPLGIWKICDGESLPFLRWQRISCGDTLTITATAGINGSISPSGTINVLDGTNQTFTFSTNNCYEIDSLWIDNVYKPDSIVAGSYTFNDVTENHIITISFKPTNFIISIFDTTCSDVPYYFAGQNLTTTGIYYDTLQNINNCDSVIELILTVNPSSLTQISKSICDGDTYDFFGKLLTVTGIYYDTLQNIYGCDSIIELDLTVASFLFTQISESICDGDTYDFHGMILTAMDIYYDTLQSVFGCDSIVELTLTVNPLPHAPTIDKNENILISSIAYSYQWHLDNQAIEGATEQTYTYTQNGIYFVEIGNEYECTSKSENINITDVGITETTVRSSSIVVYPNPANSKLHIKRSSQETADYTIYSSTGQIVSQGKLLSDISIINIESLSNGMYYLKIYMEGNTIVKFVKN